MCYEYQNFSHWFNYHLLTNVFKQLPTVQCQYTLKFSVLFKLMMKLWFIEFGCMTSIYGTFHITALVWNKLELGWFNFSISHTPYLTDNHSISSNPWIDIKLFKNLIFDIWTDINCVTYENILHFCKKY